MSAAASLFRVADQRLFGRAREIDQLRTFIAAMQVDGGALIVTGDAGVGKTMLLEAAEALANEAGSVVLRAAGAQFEADLSYAVLHQVLQPLLGGRDGLSQLHRQALEVALGLDDGRSPDPLVVSNAALALVVSSARSRPVVVILDDLPWVDRSSASALGFVARRLSGTRVGFLGAARTGEDTFFEHGGIPGHEIRPLDDTASAALLEDHFPALAPRVRQRLISEAQGNPLALLELPVALATTRADETARRSRVMPLTHRLQSVFASRISDLPEATRLLLLLAVLDGTGDIAVLRSDDERSPGLADLTPAEHARLVRVDDASGQLLFRHPLIRSAVVELSTSDERRQAHEALAARRTGDLARVAWHLAEAATGPDERVAALLHSVAHANLQRGDAVGAIAELFRAADLSPAGSDRGVRLAEAAYLGSIVLGDLKDVPALLDSVRRDDPERHGSLEGAVAGAYFLLNSDGDVDTAHRLLVSAIDALPDPTDAHYRALIEALYNLLEVCFFGGRAELWESLHLAVERLRPKPPGLLAILDKTISDPARQAPDALCPLDSAIAALEHETSAARIVRVAIAAVYVDRLSGCRSSLWRVVRDGRDGGAITSAIEALFLLSNDAYFSGQWKGLSELVDEGLALCESHNYALLTWPGRFLQGLLAASRGDQATASAVADDMTSWAAPRNVGCVMGYAAHIRTLAALGSGDYDAAYRYATGVAAAGEIPRYVPGALWMILDVVEAAVRSGHLAEARAHVAAAHELRLGDISPRLALVCAGAAAMCAPNDASHQFDTALALAGADRWPFERARIELAYGEHLRRTKAATEARQHLTAAFETFQRLDTPAWTNRAASELRASGLATRKPEPGGATSLSPQQREIALLAATGLTNKQIGERLYLSPRTVATHLYQLFPKLGVTSRAALRDALAAETAPAQHDSPPVK